MNFEKIARLVKNSGPARFFVPLGIILIVFGIILLGFNTDNFAETSGKITSVTECPFEEDEGRKYDVGVKYTAEGKEYETVFSSLAGDFNIGDDFNVYYDPDNPATATNSKTGGFIAPIMIVAGAAAMIFGVFKTVIAFKKNG